MEDRIHQSAAALAPALTALRRDLHRFPETAWTEYRTACLVARRLLDLGYNLRFGPDAATCDASPVPPEADAAAQKRALAEGADPELLRRMKGGHTALWADLPCAGHGPTVAFRFDMDANTLDECGAPGHRPCDEGFASVHPGCMHACGHDGHTALGLGLAELAADLRGHMHGTLRLIFQPAEEGGSGALSMLNAGALEGVDFLVGLHLGIRAEHTGSLICGAESFMASSGFDLRYVGKPAHAGFAPQEGRNALLAACSATLAMHALPRHGGGASRINVGQLRAGQARNIIPDEAILHVETRGISNEIDAFMYAEAQRVARAAAEMWGCDCVLIPRKSLPGGRSSPEMSARIETLARTIPGFTHIVRQAGFGATEDFTVLLDAAQQQGGQGVYIQLGATRSAGHHSDRFDFDEAALPLGLELLTRIAVDYLR